MHPLYWVFVPSRTSFWKDQSLWGATIWADSFLSEGLCMGQWGLHKVFPRDLFQPILVSCCHISDWFFLPFCMLGTSYTRSGLLCEGLSGRNADGEYALCESLPNDRASHDTNLQFSFLLPSVSIFWYFGKLNDGFSCSQEICQWYSLYVRLDFVVA